MKDTVLEPGLVKTFCNEHKRITKDRKRYFIVIDIAVCKSLLKFNICINGSMNIHKETYCIHCSHLLNDIKENYK